MVLDFHVDLINIQNVCLATEWLINLSSNELICLAYPLNLFCHWVSQCPSVSKAGCLLLLSHLYHQSWFIFPFWWFTCLMFEFIKPLILLGHPFHISLPSDKLLCISHKTHAERYTTRKCILGHLFRSWSRAGGDIYFLCIVIQASLIFLKM